MSFLKFVFDFEPYLFPSSLYILEKIKESKFSNFEKHEYFLGQKAPKIKDWPDPYCIQLNYTCLRHNSNFSIKYMLWLVTTEILIAASSIFLVFLPRNLLENDSCYKNPEADISSIYISDVNFFQKWSPGENEIDQICKELVSIDDIFHIFWLCFHWTLKIYIDAYLAFWILYYIENIHN